MTDHCLIIGVHEKVLPCAS